MTATAEHPDHDTTPGAADTEPASGPDSAIDSDLDFAEALANGELTWSYRAMLCDDGSFQVREVYTHKRTGEIAGWVGGPASLLADSVDGLARLTQTLSRALSEPLLVETELPGYEPEQPTAS